MPSIAWDPALVDVDATVGLLALPLPDESGWRLWAADRETRLAEIPWTEATDGVLTDGRGQASTLALGLDKDSTAPDLLALIEGEAHLAYNNIPLHWGPVTGWSARSSDATVGVTSVDASWYLGRRLVADQSLWSFNRVKNPGFEIGGLNGWSTTGDVTIDSEDPDAGTVSAHVDEGTVSQTISVDIEGQVTAIASARIRRDALDWPNAGIRLEAVANPSHEGDTYAESLAVGEPGEWVTVIAVVSWTQTRPVPTTWRLTGFSSNGASNFDSFTFSLSPTAFVRSIVERNAPETRPRTIDLSVALTQLIAATTSDLNIGSLVSWTGETIEAEWDAHPEKFGSEVARLLTDRERGLELSMEYTPTTRTVRGHFPHRGIALDPDDVLLRMAPGVDLERLGLCASYAITQTADGARSEMNFIDESGVWGTYRDGSAWGGVLLQDARQAPAGTPASDLPGKAREELRGSVGLVESLRMVTGDWAILAAPWGTRIRVLIDDGAVQVDGWYRVEARSIRLAARTVELTLNVWTGEV